MRKIKDQTLDYYLQHPQFANWHDISSNRDLTIDQIRRAKDHLEWYWITLNNCFTEDEIRQFQDYIYWDWVSFKNKTLNETFLREFSDQIQHWDTIHYLKISKNLRRQLNIKEIDHIIFLQYDKKEISEFINGPDWDKISNTFWLNQDVIEKYADKLNWFYLQNRGRYTIRFLWKMRKYWDWTELTKKEVIKWKEYKIAKFSKYVDWDVIKSWHWKVWSKNFEKRFKKYLN